jgi:hypothetical protein
MNQGFRPTAPTIPQQNPCWMPIASDCEPPRRRTQDEDTLGYPGRAESVLGHPTGHPGDPLCIGLVSAWQNAKGWACRCAQFGYPQGVLSVTAWFRQLTLAIVLPKVGTKIIRSPHWYQSCASNGGTPTRPDTQHTEQIR